LEKFAPGEGRILEALNAAREGQSYGELRDRTGLDHSIFSEYIRRLQRNEQITRGPDRKYRLLDKGTDTLGRRHEIAIILGAEKTLRNVIQPAHDQDAPRILPTEVSLYASPEIERMIGETREELEDEKGGHITNADARYRVLLRASAQVARIFEDLLFRRFYLLMQDWSDYHIQQMSPSQRRRYLSQVHRWVLPRRPRERRARLAQIESEYVARKFPEGGPPLTLDHLLDFQAAIVVNVSPEMLRKESQAVRVRFALFILEYMLNPELRVDDPESLLRAMSKAGLISEDDVSQWVRAKGRRGRLQVLGKLREKYFASAWGAEAAREQYPRTKVIKLPLE
jgi:DNA-binding transcriptional ArsR family regulator